MWGKNIAGDIFALLQSLPRLTLLGGKYRILLNYICILTERLDTAMEVVSEGACAKWSQRRLQSQMLCHDAIPCKALQEFGLYIPARMDCPTEKLPDMGCMDVPCVNSSHSLQNLTHIRTQVYARMHERQKSSNSIPSGLKTHPHAQEVS